MSVLDQCNLTDAKIERWQQRAAACRNLSRRLRRAIAARDQARKAAERLRQDARTLAMLAADAPLFRSPLDMERAKRLRDQVLAI
jgi:hypothetical protein